MHLSFGRQNESHPLAHSQIFHMSCGSGNYTCCKQDFKTEEGLSEHLIDVHFGGLPHKCTKNNCTYRFVHEKDLKEHVKNFKHKH